MPGPALVPALVPEQALVPIRWQVPAQTLRAQPAQASRPAPHAAQQLAPQPALQPVRQRPARCSVRGAVRRPLALAARA